MKDLFKGHHPWLLVLVIAVDIFSALVIRHSILSKGESEFNANVFFCLIIISGLALYAILVEFLSGKDMPLIGENKGKEEMVKVPASQPIAEETSVERPTVPLEQAPISRDDLEQIMRNVMSDLKREVAVPTGATITKDEDGIVSVNINEMKNSASELVRTQEDAKYRFACEYTMKVLGSYIKQRDVPTLLFRLGLFQRASTPNWDPRSSEDIEAGIKIQRIEVSAPVEKWALLHYGWNMGRLFGKQNNFITHFLKTTFHYHLDGLSDNQLPKKLKQNPLQGVIKIEERFDNPSFPIKSTCKCNLLKIRYGFFQGNQLIGINIPIIKLLNFVFCKYSKICELWVQIIGKLRLTRIFRLKIIVFQTTFNNRKESRIQKQVLSLKTLNRRL